MCDADAFGSFPADLGSSSPKAFSSPFQPARERCCASSWSRVASMSWSSISSSLSTSLYFSSAPPASPTGRPPLRNHQGEDSDSPHPPLSACVTIPWISLDSSASVFLSQKLVGSTCYSGYSELASSAGTFSFVSALPSLPLVAFGASGGGGGFLAETKTKVLHNFASCSLAAMKVLASACSTM